jgi:hypothetical protein
MLPLAGQREPLVASAQGGVPDTAAADTPDGEVALQPRDVVPARWAFAPVGTTDAPPTAPGVQRSADGGATTSGGALRRPPRPGSQPPTPAGSANGRDGVDAGAEIPLPANVPASFDGNPLVQQLLASRDQRPTRQPRPVTGAPVARAAENGSSGARQAPLPLAVPVQRQHTRHAEPEPIQRSHAPSNGPLQPTIIQRDITIDEPVVTAAEAAPEAGGAEPDVDALFAELYPRVRDELRWELRVQRERAGLLADPM